MKPIAMCDPLIFGLSLTSPVVGADDPLVLPVWPGKVPGDYGEIGSEHIRPPENAPTKDAKWLTNVTKPTITVFRPAKENNTGAAMLICPGGGYWNLAWDLEGEEVAAWLNSLGMTGFLLKYRVPRRPGQVEALPAPGPLNATLPICAFHSDSAVSVTEFQLVLPSLSAPGGAPCCRCITRFAPAGHRCPSRE